MPEGNGKAAIIVESPTKTRTLARFLGDRYRLLATMGHVRDLPEDEIAVDVKNGFTPKYVIIPGRKKVLDQIKKQVKDAPVIYLACDPDREGEAICWHVKEVLNLPDEKTARIEFNEITERAVKEALKHPRDIDMRRVSAQQARRILDRLVGYTLSPLLQRKIGRRLRSALSAGRVQSAALRLIVEREQEIAAFVPQEYWRIHAILHPEGREEEKFRAEVIERDGEKLELPNEQAAQQAAEELRKQQFTVAKIERSQRRRNPPPPFITSTMQREAANRLGFSAQRTMRIAQQLYEGVDLPEGTVGLITYMRTDSTRIAAEARQAAVQFIKQNYGDDYVGPGAKGKKVRGAQEAHEAIRPTDITRTPESVRPYLTDEQFKLYELIWRRFLASQMAPAVYDMVRADIEAGPYLLRATASQLVFPGWQAVWQAEKGKDEGEELLDRLPELEEGQRLVLVDLEPSQHFTKPPPRYTEASLVQALEEHGIGRPSTYAQIIETLRQRRYVRMRGRSFVPTRIGTAVYAYLMRYFPQIMDLEFTARMEEQLDKVERGEMEWRELLEQFYADFERWLQDAKRTRVDIIEGERCPKCGGRLVLRFSAYGPYAACENYQHPQANAQEGGAGGCDYTRDLGVPIGEACPECGAELEVAMDRDGGFVVRCPACGYRRQPAEQERESEGRSDASAGAGRRRRKPIRTGLKCPRCGEELVVRFGRRGPFVGCSAYPKCRFTRNLTPEERQRFLGRPDSEDSTGESDGGSEGATDASPAASSRPSAPDEQ